jgi:hypothetical protein
VVTKPSTAIELQLQLLRRTPALGHELTPDYVTAARAPEPSGDESSSKRGPSWVARRRAPDTPFTDGWNSRPSLIFSDKSQHDDLLSL